MGQKHSPLHFQSRDECPLLRRWKRIQLAFLFHSITIEKQTGHIFDACTCITNTSFLWDREMVLKLYLNRLFLIHSKPCVIILQVLLGYWYFGLSYSVEASRWSSSCNCSSFYSINLFWFLGNVGLDFFMYYKYIFSMGQRNGNFRTDSFIISSSAKWWRRSHNLGTTGRRWSSRGFNYVFVPSYLGTNIR
jgi:hypothetical protein